MTIVDDALRLAEQGYAVFPCKTDKSPACEHGFKDATTDPDTIRALFRRDSAKLIGVRTGKASGFDVLDLDPRHGSDTWEAANPLPATRIHMTQSRGKHILFKSTGERMPCSVGQVGPGCDVRGDDGYIIWWPASGCEVWLDTDIAPWPPAWEALARAPRKRTEIERRIECLANTPSSASGKEALRLTVEAIHAAGVTATKHVTIRDTSMRIASFVLGGFLGETEAHDAIIAAAERAGAQDMDNVENLWSSAMEKAKPRPDGSELGDMGLESKEEILAARGGRKLMIERIRLPHQIGNEPARPYIVKKFIRPGDVCAIVGPPGAGKSMLAPFIGYMVAQGKDVFGMKSNPGLVLYVAAEDLDGMAMRIKALEGTHGTTDKFGLVDVANLRHGDEASDLMATVRALKPTLVILDTVGAAFAGMVENDSADMGKVVELARRIADTGACCMLVHHTTKQNDGTARGHSSLQGTLDMLTLLGVKTEDGIVRCTVGKNRAGPSDLDIAFRQSSVTLGLDEDGDTITAPMAVALPPRRPEDRKPVKPLPASLSITLRTLTDAIDASGGEPVSVDLWKKAVLNDGVFGEDGNTFRAGFSRARRDLIDRKLVTVDKNGLASIPKQAFSGMLHPSLADLSDDAPQH